MDIKKQPQLPYGKACQSGQNQHYSGFFPSAQGSGWQRSWLFLMWHRQTEILPSWLRCLLLVLIVQNCLVT
jgi:hypothetical protein